MTLYPDLKKTVESARSLAVSPARQAVLQKLVDFVQEKVHKNEPVLLNFICTHNSRRSQLSQVWAQTVSAYLGIATKCYSGGVEVTAFNPRAVAAIKESGFKVEDPGGANPRLKIRYSDLADPISGFSKLYDDPANPDKGFAAIMTCSHADENCPFIAGADVRIPVQYEDPKAFDDTPQEKVMYKTRSMQIASEMFYVFSQIVKK